MKTLKIIWRIIINIITLAIVISIFSIASTKFESTVLAVLVIIYLNIIGFSQVWALGHLEAKDQLDKFVVEIKKLLNRDIPQEVDGYVDEYMKEIKEKEAEAMKIMMIKFYINIGFQFIIYVITILKLISALNS